MAKSNQAIPEIRWQAVVDGVVADLLPSSPVTSPNNQDITGLFNSAMDGIFAGLSKKSDVPSVLPVSNYRDGIFTALSTKNTVNSKAGFLPVTHCQDGKLADLWTESQGSKPTILSGGVVPRDGLFSDLWKKASSSSSVTAKNNQTHPGFRCQPEWDLDGIFAEFSKKSTPLFCVPGKATVLPDPDHPDEKITASKVSDQTNFSYPIVTRPHGPQTSKSDIEVLAYSIPMSSTMLDHHVQRAIKENEDNVPLEYFSEDHNLYHLIREVVNRVISTMRTGSFSSVPVFLPKATVLSDLDHPDGIFSDLWTKASTSSVPSKATVLPESDQRDKKRHKATLIDPPDSKEPIQKIVSYPKVGLVEPSSEQPDGGGICQGDFKNFVVEDYPHPKDENSVCLSDFNEDQDVLEYVNLALEDYNRQKELIYELVEIVKVSVTGLGGLLYHMTFKAMSPQKELTTFEAEVFARITKKEVWRVGIRKPGSDWFDGKLYWPKYDPSD